jgi:hypothetical protein
VRKKDKAEKRAAKLEKRAAKLEKKAAKRAAKLEKKAATEQVTPVAPVTPLPTDEVDVLAALDAIFVS